MTLSQMRNRVFSYINYVDGSGDPVASADISTTDVDNWINDRYIEEIFPEYSRLRPEYFIQEAYFNNYQATGTVAATSTGSTLDTSSGIFTTNMVDAIVYNTTDSESRKITAYTDSTTVTVDEDIDDDWDGDTIYVFSGICTFGGDMTDCYRVEWVGVKYDDSDEDFTRATRMSDRDMHGYKRGRNAMDNFSQSFPIYEFESVDVSGTPTSAIRIKPFDWEEAITRAVFVRYIEKPAVMSSDNNVPRLPLGHHKTLVFGATADAFRKLGMFEDANQFEGQFQGGLRRILRSHPAERKKRYINTGKYTYGFLSRTI